MKQFTLIIFLITTYLQAQWIQSSGPGGGTITAFAISGSTLFAGTETGGVYRSTNNGESWSFVSKGLTSMTITSFVVSGEKIFVGTQGGAVFCSTDNGTSWNAIYITDSSVKIISLAVLDSNIFVATYSGIYRSTDNGNHWVTIRSNTYIYSLIIVDKYIFAATNGYGLLRSTNSGDSWDIILGNGTTPPYGNVEVLGSLDTILFAKLNYNLFRSTDKGNNWTNINDSLPITALVASGNNLFAGKDHGEILRSTDNGETWAVVSNDLYLKILKTFTVLDNSLFIGTEHYGVYRSNNNGENWSAVNYGLANTTASTFTISGTNLFVGTEHQGVFLSTNNGTNWIKTNNDDFPKVANNMNRLSGVVPVNALVASEGTLFAGTNSGGVYRSTDNGNEWVAINNGLINGNGYYVNALAISDTIIYAGTFGGVYQTTNNGDIWNLSDSSIKNLVISSFAIKGNNLLAGCFEPGVGVLYSTNNGASWDTIKSGLSSFNSVTSFAILDSNLLIGTFYGVYKLINDTLVYVNGISSIPVLSLAVFNNNIFVRNINGVFLSTNRGTNWVNISDGIPKHTRSLMNSSVLNTFAVDNENIFIGTAEYGVWKRPLAEVITSVGNTISSIPTEFTLSQNYPNPFNPVTTINYTVHKTANVKLIIYDALGRQVRTLVDETKSAGKYQVEFNANNVSSGIYFYRIQTSEFVLTKKLILVK